MIININQIKTKVLPIVKQAGVTRCAIFGSYVRGEAREESDIDLLVDVPYGTGLFAFVSLKNKLETTLKKKVDLVTYNSINPYIRESILKDQLLIL
ncbi:MAG: nucleotidyltransferase family protein [Candidatus Shapirobacteria bacterium]